MVKFQNRTIEIIAILLMLSVSPLSITYSFADLSDYQDEKDNNPDVQKNIQNSRLRIILTEKLVNGKLEVRHYALPDDFSDYDIQRMPSFVDKTPGWAYVNYKTFHSGIVIFDGNASKVGELTINSEKSISYNQEFRNLVSVR